MSLIPLFHSRLTVRASAQSCCLLRPNPAFPALGTSERGIKREGPIKKKGGSLSSSHLTSNRHPPQSIPRSHLAPPQLKPSRLNQPAAMTEFVAYKSSFFFISPTNNASETTQVTSRMRKPGDARYFASIDWNFEAFEKEVKLNSSLDSKATAGYFPDIVPIMGNIKLTSSPESFLSVGDISEVVPIMDANNFTSSLDSQLTFGCVSDVVPLPYPRPVRSGDYIDAIQVMDQVRLIS